MNLPINLNDLLKAQTVESDRVEYKKGWNSEAVLHTMTAFANDFYNQGGGYLIIGIRAEDGVPQLPPDGLQQSQLDPIQRELLALSHRISPQYFPIAEIAVIGMKNVIVIWCPGGQNRPYKCPFTLATGNSRFPYYIRRFSNTVIANHDEEIELMQMAASIPFDDRINQHASTDNIDLGLIRSYLQSVKSDLFGASVKMQYSDLLQKMNLVDGSPERLYPKNVALMFFNASPDSFFPQTQIDIVHFPEGEGAKAYTEKIFKGPLGNMLQEALDYIKASYIIEMIIKQDNVAEAIRVFNYPFPALEEALCNAVYHRSYEIREPIEIKILPDKISISSFPGPDRSITDKDLIDLRFISRRYRNRRLGEFLKELHLTEGRGTGIPNIIRSLADNGSEPAKIYTDENRTYFVIEFQIHKDYLRQLQELRNKAAHDTAEDTMEDTMEVMKICKALKDAMSGTEIRDKLGLKNADHFRKAYIAPALEKGFIEMTIPDKPTSRNQKYRLTEKGKNLLQVINTGNKEDK